MGSDPLGGAPAVEAAVGSVTAHAQEGRALSEAEEAAKAAEAAAVRKSVRVDEVSVGRSFNSAEQRIVDLLESEGRQVTRIAEGTKRTPDALVDGVPTEFKSLDPGASNATVKAALNDAKGQARDVVIDARGSGLTQAEAERGIRRFLGAHPKRFDHIRIVADGFEIRQSFQE
jgi:hypothetical protein